MDGYFWMDCLTAEEVLYVPRVFVAKFLKRTGIPNLDYSTTTLARCAEVMQQNREDFKKFIERGLVTVVEVDDDIVAEFIDNCHKRRKQKALSNAGELFYYAQEEFENPSVSVIFEDSDEEYGEDEEYA